MKNEEIRAGRFCARLIKDGYEVHDDENGRIATVHLPEAARGQIRRDASADVAQRHHQSRASMLAAVASSPQTGRSRKAG